MLPKTYRLKEKKDFRRIYQKGNTINTPYFVLYYRTNKNEETRIGFSVSKKNGNAVVRNRLKRRFREACRVLLKGFPQGFDYILIVRNSAKRASYAQLLEKILDAVGQVKLKLKAGDPK